MALPPPASSALSSFTADAFLTQYWTRIQWGAVFGLFITWGLTWFMRHAFGQADEPGLFSNTAGAGPYAKRNPAVDPEASQTVGGTTTTGGPGVTTGTGYNTGTGANPGYNTSGTTGTGVNDAAGANTTTAAGDPAYTEKPTRIGGGGLMTVFNSFNRSHDMLRDLLLMLLTVMVLNTFARGLTRAVAVLAWLFFAFAAAFALFEGIFAHRFARLAYSVIFFGLALAIGGIAFAWGF